MKRIAVHTATGALIAAGLLAPQPAAAAITPAATDEGATYKTLVIGLDGGMLDYIESGNTPHMHDLMEKGTFAHSQLYATSNSPHPSQLGGSTGSGPGWSSILTGVWPDKHGVRDNSFAGKDYETYPSFLDRVEQVNPDLNTLGIASWNPVVADEGQIISPAVDEVIATSGSDDRAEEVLVERLSGTGPDVSFIQLNEPDIVGHSYGSESPLFTAALEKQDERIGNFLAAIDARETRAQENWNIIITSDHGHLPTGGHGGTHPTERATFVIAAGDDFEDRGEVHNVNVSDIAPTVLGFAGIDIDPSWGLDGVPIGTDTTDDFDALRSALKPRVDEIAVPAGTLGFTHTPPPGWSVDNSAMATGGMTEWRGWTFATQEFWSAVERGQARENFTRGREVIAVADGDEWSDAETGEGKFDSSLVTPAYDVSGASEATLTFQHSYRPWANQTAQVLVSFDGAEPIEVANYTEDVNGAETLVTAVPEGTMTAQYRFRYTGANDWFWAVDQVRFAGDSDGPGTDPVGEAGVPLVAEIEESAGALSLSVEPTDGVALQGGLEDDHLDLSGALPDVTVNDTRADAAGWSASGQSTRFSDDDQTTAIGADRLGWTPRLVEGRPGVVAGEKVDSSLTGGQGLSSPQNLATADAVGRQGSTSLAADLSLKVPATTGPGSYAATLTVSLFPID